MKITLEDPGGGYVISGYADGEVRIAEPGKGEVTVLRQSLIISAATLITDWPPQSLEELEASHLEQVAGLQSEVVLLGTGARLRFPDMAVLAPIIARGAGFEIMDTAAACRTYNILAGEGRTVAAALLIG